MTASRPPLLADDRSESSAGRRTLREPRAAARIEILALGGIEGRMEERLEKEKKEGGKSERISPGGSEGPGRRRDGETKAGVTVSTRVWQRRRGLVRDGNTTTTIERAYSL
jgi:hypothetical protein